MRVRLVEPCSSNLTFFNREARLFVKLRLDVNLGWHFARKYSHAQRIEASGEKPVRIHGDDGLCYAAIRTD